MTGEVIAIPVVYCGRCGQLLDNTQQVRIEQLVTMEAHCHICNLHYMGIPIKRIPCTAYTPVT